MTLTIIIPVLNEAAGIEEALRALVPYRTRGVEVIVADGGSCDATVERARPLADRVITAPRGRAAQMNAGVGAAQGDILLFLHADTRLPDHTDALVQEALAAGRVWGRFDVRFEDGALPLIAFMMNLRSRVTGISTGDQAMFVARDVLRCVGGFPAIALMEDVALSKRLKRLGPPACIRNPVTTSPRRWRQHGTLRTVLLMWRLRLAYFLGADPAKLARSYGYSPAD